MASFLYKVAATVKNRSKVTKHTKSSLTKWLNDNTWSSHPYIDNSINIYAFIVLILTIAYFISPVRICILRRFKDYIEKTVDDGKENFYKVHAKYFSDDYESLNPLTAKEGKIRMLKW